jgi:LPXTG-motif cell wall-anchored protein
LLVFVWLFGTNNPGLLLALGLVIAGSAVYLWRKNRSEMRSVLGELGPPEKSSASGRVMKAVGVADFRRAIGGTSGYGSPIDP